MMQLHCNLRIFLKGKQGFMRTVLRLDSSLKVKGGDTRFWISDLHRDMNCTSKPSNIGSIS